MKFTKRRSQDVPIHSLVDWNTQDTALNTNQSINQSINQLINQSINPSILTTYLTYTKQQRNKRNRQSRTLNLFRIVLALTYQSYTKGKFGLSPSSCDALESFLTINFHLVKQKVLNLCRLKHDCNNGLKLYQNKKFIHHNHPIFNRIGIKILFRYHTSTRTYL